MKKLFINAISYIVISTTLLTTTITYANNIDVQAIINEEEELENELIMEDEIDKVQYEQETSEDKLKDSEKYIESEEVKEVEEIKEEIKKEVDTNEEIEIEKIEVEEPKQNPVIIPKKFVNSSKKYTLQDIERDIKGISEHYKEVVSVETIGNSYEGKPINAIKLGLPSEVEKPSVLLLGNIHAREDFSATLVMKMLDYISYSYYDTGHWGNYNVKDILNQIDIYFIPVANPDGLNIAHNGIEASSNYNYLKTIPNVSGDYRWWKSNGRGVDLNKNFDDGNWNVKESNGRPSSEGYKGESPNSELETQVIQKFCNEKKPLLAISYHTSGNVFFWADKDTHKVFKGHDTEIINRMRNITGYRIMPVSQNPQIFGSGFENWFKKKFHRFAICVELSPSPNSNYVQHSDEKFNSLVWEKAKFTGIQLALEGINIEDRMYNVYQNENYLKTFYTYQEALAYSNNWKNGNVRKKVYHVHQGNNYLKTFHSQKEAMNYAKLWSGYKIVSEEKKI